MMISRLTPGSSPNAAQQRHHPADVAVVVGAEQDQAPVEAALALVEVVRRVTGDVGAVTVALDDHAVLVVAVLLGAEPGGAVLLVDVAELAQPRDGAVGGARLVEVVLVEVGVEGHPEVGEGLLDLVEHDADAVLPERLERLLVGQIRRLGVVGDDRGRDLGDVLPGVAVLGRRLVTCGGEQRPAVPVDLGAVVVEVVLPADLVAAGLEQSREAVADRGPAGTGQRHRTGRVGRDELDVDLLLAALLGPAVRRARRDDVVGDRALGDGVDADVEEARPGDVDARDAVGGAESLGDQGREVAWRRPGPLGQLEGDVRRVVAVALLPGSLHRDRPGHAVGQRDRALGGEVRQGRDDQVGELLGCHRARVSAHGARPRPTSANRIGEAPRASTPVSRAACCACKVVPPGPP